MSRLRIHLAAAALLLALPLPGLAEADPQRILAASDAVRNPGRAFTVQIALAEFNQGRQVAASTMITHSRILEQGGQFASLVRFVTPARDAGKIMLRNGSDLWFYDPSTRASVRISPQQRLIGQASNGDVVTVNFARDYRASLAGQEEIQDGERNPRQAYKLELEPASDDATYGRVELWVDATSSQPIMGRFMADSGRLLKTVYYRRFQRQLGAERPTEMVIIDGLNPQSVTLMRLTDYRARDLPGTWFQRDALPNLQLEP